MQLHKLQHLLLAMAIPLALPAVPDPGSAWSLQSDEDKVKFFFFLRYSFQQDGNISFNAGTNIHAEDLKGAGFDPRMETKILIHGFNTSATGECVQSIRNAFDAAALGYNVFAVDWSALSAAPWYVFSRFHVHEVGQYVANLIDFLVSEQLISLDRLHLVGHSLGAHVAAQAAMMMTSPGQVSRITGLDPARPMFNVHNPRSHLSARDAALVDVIHTNAGFLGMQERLGHVDFYPNGGKGQPGCNGTSDLLGVCVCSHSRSYLLFAESILNPTAFKAYLCKDETDAYSGSCQERGSENATWAIMGYFVQFSEPGAYYLRTRGASPYSYM